MTREEAIEVVRKNLPHLGIGATEMTDALETLIPELAESEDERIRKLLIWQVHRNIEDETNDLAQSVYDGIKGHDPDLEESIEDWKKCLAYLEKQKEQKNTSASTMAPSCWEVEQKEQKPKAKAKSPLSPHELYDAKIEGISQGRQDVLDHPEQFGLQKPADLSEMMVHKEPYIAPVPTPMVADEQKPDTRDADDLQLLGFIYDLLNEIEWKDNWAMSKDECLRRLNNYRPQKPVSISCGHENDVEWGQEDKEKIVTISEIIEHCTTIPYSGGTLTLNKEYKKELLCFIRTLRPSWKPSEHQMTILKAVKDYVRKGSGYWGEALGSLIEDLEKL